MILTAGVFIGLFLGTYKEELLTLDVVGYSRKYADISFMTVLSTNFYVVILLSVGGLFSLGLFSVFILLVTGMQLGMACYIIFLSDPKLILLLLPHGFIEIAGLVLASSVGIKPLLVVYKYLRGDRKVFEEYVSKGKITLTLRLIFTAVLLIILAAFIESFVTGGILLRSLIY